MHHVHCSCSHSPHDEYCSHGSLPSPATPYSVSNITTRSTSTRFLDNIFACTCTRSPSPCNELYPPPRERVCYSSNSSWKSPFVPSASLSHFCPSSSWKWFFQACGCSFAQRESAVEYSVGACPSQLSGALCLIRSVDSRARIVAPARVFIDTQKNFLHSSPSCSHALILTNRAFTSRARGNTIAEAHPSPEKNVIDVQYLHQHLHWNGREGYIAKPVHTQQCHGLVCDI